jgi:hypothetical protein
MHLVSWSNLGFPKEEGHYDFAGMDIWVRTFDVERAEKHLAEGNDDAVFDLIIAEPIDGPKQYYLGLLYKGGESSGLFFLSVSHRQAEFIFFLDPRLCHRQSFGLPQTPR